MSPGESVPESGVVAATGGSTSGIWGRVEWLYGTLRLPNGQIAEIEPSLATLLSDGSGRMWIAFAQQTIAVSSASAGRTLGQ